MKITAEITGKTLALFLLTLAFGTCLGAGVVLTRDKFRDGTVDLACGRDNFIVPKSNASLDLEKSCRNLTSLMDKAQMQSRAEDVAMPRLHCSVTHPSEFGHGAATIFLGSERVSPDHAVAFNAICERYKAQFAQLPTVTLDGSPDASARYNERMRAEQTLSTEVRAELKAIAQSDSQQQQAWQEIQQVERELRRKVIEAGGGYKIMRDREGVIVVSNPQ